MTAALKEHLKDERIWAIAARVAVHEGEDTHFEIAQEGHIVLSVVTLRHGIEIKALLCGGDDSGTGVWFIPSVGTEVIVNFDDGEFEGDAYVVAIVGEKPGGISLTQGKVLVIGDDIEIRSVDGTAVKLSKHDECKAFRDWVYKQFAATGGHTHVVVGGSTTTIATVSGGINAPAPSVPPDFTGTTVVKGE